MGQKVSPIGLRIGINKDWESKWYANKKDFSKYLNNDVKLRGYLEKKFKTSGISEIRIERNYESKDRAITLKPVTEMQLNDDENYENLVDKFLASKPVDEQPKAMPIVSNGFDLKEAVTPKDDLSEIMKAFDFYGGNDEE